jgi:hypothetical protein
MGMPAAPFDSIRRGRYAEADMPSREVDQQKKGVPLFWKKHDKVRVVFTTLPSTIVPCKKRGIYPSDHRISQDYRNKTRFMHLYYSHSRLVREARGNHCHTSLEHQAHPWSCRRCPPLPLSSQTTAAVVNGSYSSWQCVGVRPVNTSGGRGRRPKKPSPAR